MEKAETTVRRPADVLLNYYNTICRVRVKPYEKNLKLIEKCLKLNNQDESDLTEYMKWYCLYKNDQDLKPDFEECMREYGDYYNLTFGDKEIIKVYSDCDNATAELEPKPGEEQEQKEIEIEVADVLESGDLVEKTSKKSTKGRKNTEDKSEGTTGRKKKGKKVVAVEAAASVADLNAVQQERGEEMTTDVSEKTQVPQVNNTDSFGMLGASMAGLFQSLISDALSSQYKGLLEEAKKEIRDFVEERYGERTQVVKLVFDDERLHPLDEDEISHEKLQEVLNFVMANEPVYLVGPTGCGKNHICKQVAKILDLPFYFSNAVTQEYKLVGFTDANGVYQETQFYKAFKSGGIFMLDEIDASLPDALIILNAAISNGYFDFPAPIGFVEAHPDFRIIAAGNTWGYGADIQYVGRNQLDMASLDRFAVVYMDYSYNVESALCPNQELHSFLREYRGAIYSNGLMSTVSYRAFRRLYLLEEQFDNLSECLDSCLCKGLCKDDLRLIYKQIKTESKYKEALKVLVDARRE